MTPTPRTVWPRHRSERRPWRSALRGRRADRTVTEIVVAIPPRIAGLPWAAPDRGTADLLRRAAAALADLDGRHGARLGALGRLLVRTEAVASSRIEHVEASADDYGRALVGSRANDAASSMVAAAGALVRMVDAAGSGVVAERALLDAHRVLLRDDPIDAGYAGRYRDVQNWIGGGATPRDARHVPPPPELVPALMDDLFAFIARDDVDAVAQAAIAHAQLESIHPFTDGNGRIGRALVGAVLRRRGLTTTVVAPIATALAADRDAYFSRLDAYRDGSVDDLVVSFATAIGIVSDEATVTAIELESLPGRWVAPDAPSGRVLAGLIEDPLLTEDRAESLTGLSAPALDAAIDPLVRAGILRPLTARRRNRAWAVTEVVEELDDLAERITTAVRGRRHHDLLAAAAA